MENTTTLIFSRNIPIILFMLISPFLILFINSIDFLYPIEKVILTLIICLIAFRIFITPFKATWKKIIRGIWVSIIVMSVCFVLILSQFNMFPDTLISRSFQVNTLTVHYTIRSASWKKHHSLHYKSTNINGTKIESHLFKD